MHEEPGDVDVLQALLDDSAARMGTHTGSIIDPSRRLDARQLVNELVGMKVLVIATVTASGEPRTSCVDGHFVRGRWWFTTSGTAYKAKHLARHPAVSATYADGERIGVFTHGTATRIRPPDPAWAMIEEHLVAHYGASPTEWGPDIAYFRIDPSRMLAFASDAAQFPG